MHNSFINAYHFTAEWGGSRIEFSEISGLDIEIDVINYRTGNSPEEQEIKIPGITRFPNVTFKRSIRKGDKEFFSWISTKRFGQVERRNIRISLLNENHEPIFVWLLKNCFPVKYTGPVLLSNDSEVAVESLTVAHEGFYIETE